MAGTLTISTLSDGTNSTSSTNCIQGSAKAWVNINGASGASPTIRASYNVSSVTRTGTGQYTVTMNNAMTDANYAVLVTIRQSGYNNNQRCYESSQITKTSSVYGIATEDGLSYSDFSNVYTAIFR
jgi:hypothetical protein